MCPEVRRKNGVGYARCEVCYDKVELRNWVAGEIAQWDYYIYSFICAACKRMILMSGSMESVDMGSCAMRVYLEGTVVKEFPISEVMSCLMEKKEAAELVERRNSVAVADRLSGWSDWP